MEYREKVEVKIRIHVRPACKLTQYMTDELHKGVDIRLKCEEGYEFDNCNPGPIGFWFYRGSTAEIIAKGKDEKRLKESVKWIREFLEEETNEAIVG